MSPEGQGVLEPDRAEAAAATTPGRTAHGSRSRGGWFSQGPFPGDPDILIPRPDGAELTCTEKNLGKC